MLIAQLGSHIRQARKARGLTQAALARGAGISRETLVKLESGLARDLGVAKILRLLGIVGLEILVVDAPMKAGTDYVALAASAASTGFRERLAEDELVRALLSGVPTAGRRPHLRRLLEDSPAQLVRGLVKQVAAWAKPGRVEKNLAALAKKLDLRPRPEWTTRA